MIFTVVALQDVTSIEQIWNEVDNWASPDPNFVLCSMELLNTGTPDKAYIEGTFTGTGPQKGRTSTMRYQGVTINGIFMLAHCAHTWQGTPPPVWPIIKLGDAQFF